MAKKADGGWTSKNQKPGYIPPFKTPRSVTVVEKRNIRRQPKEIVLITETEENERESEEDTQFGVVWEKMTEAQLKMADNTKTTTLTATPEPIAYVGEPWRDKTRPIVLITETEETERETSDVEEDNIPLSQTLDKIPTGEMCIGLTVLKQFDEGLFKGTVTDAKKQRARYLYHVVYEDGDSEDLNEKEFMKLFMEYEMAQFLLTPEGKVATKEEKTAQRNFLKEHFKQLPQDILDVYVKGCRERLAYHGVIKEAIVDTLNDNNEQSFRSLDKVSR
jgi:hypothetical protein